METATQIGVLATSNGPQPLCIPPDLRLLGTHIIGLTGTGKSTLVEWMALQDIQRGDGIAVFDPDGQLAERLLRLIPPRHADRVVYPNPADPRWVVTGRLKTSQ